MIQLTTNSIYHGILKAIQTGTSFTKKDSLSVFYPHKIQVELSNGDIVKCQYINNEPHSTLKVNEKVSICIKSYSVDHAEYTVRILPPKDMAENRDPLSNEGQFQLTHTAIRLQVLNSAVVFAQFRNSISDVDVLEIADRMYDWVHRDFQVAPPF